MEELTTFLKIQKVNTQKDMCKKCFMNINGNKKRHY